jgi:hypothetical protein
VTTIDMAAGEPDRQMPVRPEAMEEGAVACVFGELVPVFDKGLDDRLPVARWHAQPLPVDAVIVEGWCLGLPPQAEADLVAAVNALEAVEDADGGWRQFVNERLRHEYARFFARFDRLLVLLPPDFDAVLRWRTQQEQALPPAQRMDAAALRRFVAHYERLTRHGLRAWPALADWCVTLAPDHRIAGINIDARIRIGQSVALFFGHAIGSRLLPSGRDKGRTARRTGRRMAGAKNRSPHLPDLEPRCPPRHRRSARPRPARLRAGGNLLNRGLRSPARAIRPRS